MDITNDLLDMFHEKPEKVDPFEGAKIYKIYHKEERRYYASIVYSKQDTTTMSWARYTMCCHLGRILSPEEHVDHRDENKRNDDIDNLQILTQVQNSRKTFQMNNRVHKICVVCGTPFDVPKRQRKIQCCSRRCGGIWSHK